MRKEWLSVYDKLKTFVLVDNNEIISPVMTSTREFARILQLLYDDETCKKHLSDSQCNYDANYGLETFFNSGYENTMLQSWYLSQSSSATTMLAQRHIIDMKDCSPININGEIRKMIRVYTYEQVEEYIRKTIDSDVWFTKRLCLKPYLVKLQPIDYNTMIIPTIDNTPISDIVRQKHAEIRAKNTKSWEKLKPIKLTLAQIEKELGYKIQLIEE